MNSLTRIMSYDKTKNENQENCNCEECVGIDDVSKKKEIIENFNYDNFLIKIKNHQLICKEKEFLTILNLRYWYKDEKTKKFIWKALHVHGDKYDYYKTIYIKSKEKIQIECKNKHCFLQTPHDHLGGHGCKKCQHEKLAKEQTLKLEEFIIQANSVHGFGRYDYSKVKYVNYQTKVCIICKEHGNKDYEFWQTPHNHLNGVGCPLCGIKNEMKVKN